MTKIRLTQRRALLIKARKTAQDKVAESIRPVFQKQLQVVERFLRKGNLRKRLNKIDVSEFTKGESEGHPFRGNQWTGGLHSVEVDPNARKNYSPQEHGGVSLEELAQAQLPDWLGGEVKVSYLGQKIVLFEATLRDEQGRKIGSSMRRLNPDNTVSHLSFELDPSSQGQDLGSDLYEQIEASYIKAGFKGIRLTANDEVGGYAWARLGYDFRTPDDLKEIRAVAQATWDIVAAQAQKERGIPYEPMPDFEHPWELAAMSSPYDNGERFGKFALLGSSWRGYKDLTPGSQSLRIGEAYYAAKRNSR